MQSDLGAVVRAIGAHIMFERVSKSEIQEWCEDNYEVEEGDLRIKISEDYEGLSKTLVFYEGKLVYVEATDLSLDKPAIFSEPEIEQQEGEGEDEYYIRLKNLGIDNDFLRTKVQVYVSGEWERFVNYLALKYLEPPN